MPLWHFPASIQRWSAAAHAKAAQANAETSASLPACRTLLTTEERFFKHGRKPDASKEELEGLFRRMLGAKVGVPPHLPACLGILQGCFTLSLSGPPGVQAVAAAASKSCSRLVM